MKRLKIVLVILLVLPLAGCIQKYKASEEQSNAVAEYMAGLILNSDEDYDQDLIPANDTEDNNTNDTAITKTTSQTTTGNITESDASIDKTAIAKKNYTLTEIIGNKNFKINYKSFKITDSYPENGESTYFSIDPREGYQLFVATFAVKNVAGSSKTLDLRDEDILYQLETNDGTIYEPLLTLLKNNLQYINLKISGKKTENVLLIFEVSKHIKQTDINLITSNGSKSGKIEIN